MLDFLVPCLVTGARGMLGHDLCAALNQAGVGYVATDLGDIDVGSLDSVRHVFNDVKPGMVINLAAMTDVDGCESSRDEAFRVNATGPENLALASKDFGSYFVHISTDYVFDGSKNEPYLEDDAPNPLGIYGKSKLEGETRLKGVLERNYLIVRTQWLYGSNGKNFVDTIVGAAKRNNKLKIVNDQWGAPTYTVDLADSILKLCQLKPSGIFHVTNSETTTWCNFASRILNFAGIDGVEIEEISTDQLARPAPRPLYSVLDTSKFERFTGLKMRPWDAAVRQYISTRNY